MPVVTLLERATGPQRATFAQLLQQVLDQAVMGGGVSAP